MFRLALAFGCTVKELSEKINSRELTEWMAYYSIEPWGSIVEGYRDALTCATIANSGLLQASPKTLKKKPFHPEDFLLNKKKPKQTLQQQKLIMERNMIAHNNTRRK